MTYTISKISQDIGIEASTLRYYEKEGLINPQRSPSGIRCFTDEDVEKLSMICCLKRTGMALKDIRKFFDLVAKGDETIEERVEMFKERKIHLLKEIEEFQSHLDTVNWKIGYYENLIKERDKE